MVAPSNVAFQVCETSEGMWKLSCPWARVCVPGDGIRKRYVYLHVLGRESVIIDAGLC